MNLKVLYNLFLHDFYSLFVKFNSVIYCLYIMFSVNMLYTFKNLDLLGDQYCCIERVFPE